MLTSIEGIYENGQVRLLEPVPGVARARVVVTLLPEPAEPDGAAAALGATAPLSDLGRDLLAIRQCALARGQALAPVDAILEEVRKGRAEAGDDHDLR